MGNQAYEHKSMQACEHMSIQKCEHIRTYLLLPNHLNI